MQLLPSTSCLALRNRVASLRGGYQGVATHPRKVIRGLCFTDVNVPGLPFAQCRSLTNGVISHYQDKL